MDQLRDFKNKVQSSKMPPDRKQNLLTSIDGANNHFTAYANLINTIEQLATQRLD